jgi:hypothetical protein
VSTQSRWEASVRPNFTLRLGEGRKQNKRLPSSSLSAKKINSTLGVTAGLQVSRSSLSNRVMAPIGLVLLTLVEVVEVVESCRWRWLSPASMSAATLRAVGWAGGGGRANDGTAGVGRSAAAVVSRRSSA